MSDPSVTLKQGWLVLEESSDVTRAVPTGFFLEAGEIIQALTTDGHRRVLMPLAEGPGPEDLMSAGVKLRNSKVGSSGHTSSYLEIRCELPRLNDLFDDVAGEMISAAIEGDGEPGPACVEVLDRWRALLRSVRGDRPSRSSVVGILGEMLVAERILERDPLRRIDIWVGREGQRHDFRRGDRAIEVKATLATEGRSITVHGVHQLEEPDGGRLHLAWIRFEHVPGGEFSISSMIGRLCALGVPAEMVHAGLDAHGLPPGTWPEEEFELRDMAIYEVDEDFPRITSSSLTSSNEEALADVRYRVNLDMVDESLDNEGVGALFEEIATI